MKSTNKGEKCRKIVQPLFSATQGFPQMSLTPLSNPGERRRGVHDRFPADGPVVFPPLFRFAESAATRTAPERLAV